MARGPVPPMNDSLPPAGAPPAAPDPRDALERAAAASFVLFAAALPWTIAPMGIATGLCGALTLALVATRRARWPRTPLDLPALAWALALALAAWFALDREASLPRLGKALFPALAGLAALHAARAGRGRRALATYLGSAALAAALGLALFVARGAGFESRARGAVGHYMTFAGQLLLALGPALGVALLARERRWRIGALAAALVMAAALAATYTRSAWLGLLAALAVMFGFARPRWLPALAAAAALAVVAAPGDYRARLVSVVDPSSPWNRERAHMWEAGARMFRDRPLTGVGLMDLKPVYERYRSAGAREPAGHLHSVPVQVAATTGALGLAALVALAAGLLACAMRGLPAAARAGGLAAGLRLGVAGAFAGFLVAGLFEWNLGDEELLYPLYALAGLAWAAREWEGGAIPAAVAKHRPSEPADSFPPDPRPAGAGRDVRPAEPAGSVGAIEPAGRADPLARRSGATPHSTRRRP